jgi:hypothetical protein
MTASQYERNRESLAFRFAVHAAFGNNLAIVGMSLDDEYLREQLEEHRGGVENVYWFVNELPTKHDDWASRNQITTVLVDWPEFWAHWLDLPIELDQKELSVAWYLAVKEATVEAEGGELGSLERSLSQLPRSNIPPSLAELAGELAGAGLAAGEPARSRAVRGHEPSTIELALRQRLIDAKIKLPSDYKSYPP